MKLGNITISIAAAIIGMLVGFQAHAQVQWLETKHDFGTFDEEIGKVSCVMRFVNMSPGDVVIEEVRPTCGCTAGSYPHHAIAPGDTASITLTYNPAGRPGKFSKDVHVRVSGVARRIVLNVSGNVIGSESTVEVNYPRAVGSMKFNRLLVPYGEIHKGNVPSQFIKGYNQSRDTLLVSFEGLPPYINAIAVPERIAPSELTAITLYYNTNRQPAWGRVDDFFNVVVTDTRRGTVAKANVEVTANITEDFSRMTEKEIVAAPVISFSTIRLDAGKIKSGSKKAIKLALRITNNGKSVLKIRKMSSSSNFLTIQPTTGEVAAGKSLDVTVILSPDQVKSRIINAKIEIMSNDPAKSVSTVRLVGQIIE